ncbi:MAG: hypothetical protein ACNA78_08485 [Balneolaceae bacterium]
MKSSLSVLLLTVFMLTAVPAVQAQNFGTGVGATIGEPTGISFKSWLTDRNAISGALSFSISDNNSTFYTHFDFHRHTRFEQLGWDAGDLFFYYGAGLRYFWRDAGINDNFWAIRLPVGINFQFLDASVDFFTELTPMFEVEPDFEFSFGGALGFRYFFN